MFLHCIAHIICSLSLIQPSATDNEAKFFGPPVMLTSPSMFVKAGESYFDPQTKRIIFQAIEHPKNGEPVKMSTRKAQYVTLDELIEEVGKKIDFLFIDLVKHLYLSNFCKETSFFLIDNHDYQVRKALPLLSSSNKISKIIS